MSGMQSLANGYLLWGNEVNLNVDLRLRLRVVALKRAVGNKSACSPY